MVNRTQVEEAGQFCYCAIGAGGVPCVDRTYCDENKERVWNNGRCRSNCRTAKENWIEGFIAGESGEHVLPGEAYDEWKRKQAKK